jgi:hypothetical protein
MKIIWSSAVILIFIVAQNNFELGWASILQKNFRPDWSSISNKTSDKVRWVFYTKLWTRLVEYFKQNFRPGWVGILHKLWIRLGEYTT